MATVFLEVKVDDREVQNWFTYAGYKIRDAREPLRRSWHSVIKPGIVEQFDTEGERTGGWRPLNEFYQAWKERHYPGMPILELTGTMKLEMLDEHAVRITKDSMRYAPITTYAHWHQEGGYIPGRPPQRQILVITTEDELFIEGIFELWLDELRESNRRRGALDTAFEPDIPFFNVLGA